MVVILGNLKDTTNIEVDSIKITSEKVMREEKNILEMSLCQLIVRIAKNIKVTTNQGQTTTLMKSQEMKELRESMTDDCDRYLFIIIIIHHQ